MFNKSTITIALLFMIIYIVFFNYSGTENNIINFIKKHSSDKVKVKCDGFDRNYKCVFNASPKLINQLVKGLNLLDFESRAIYFESEGYKHSWDDVDYYNYWDKYKSKHKDFDKSYNCASLEYFQNPKLVKIYGILRTPPEIPSELRLENGTAFENFFLFHRLDTNEACVHFTYAYG